MIPWDFQPSSPRAGPDPGGVRRPDTNDMKDNDSILLAHGGGGRLSRELIDQEIVPRFGDGPLRDLPDAARLPAVPGELVYTTDSFVVQPIEFPGGNIGDLAVHGTVNDLAVAGAVPKWISLALIIEEGLPIDLLRKVLDSVRSAAEQCSVTVATGDTKVVGRGQCDGLYVNTSGIGVALDGFMLGRRFVREGDRVLASGPLGDHGAAVLCARQGIDIDNGPDSDTGPVHRLVIAAHEWAPAVRFMRDPTRGGAAAVLNEAVEGTGLAILLREPDLPFSSGLRAVSALLGLDPLHIASEGRCLAICGRESADAVLEAWQQLPEGEGAVEIGEIVSGPERVILETVTGGRRLVDVPRGELLPRIC